MKDVKIFTKKQIINLILVFVILAINSFTLIAYDTSKIQNVNISSEGMMTRTLTKAGINTKVDLDKVTKFSDDDQMHEWGKEAIYYMSNIEIIKGMGDGTFGVLGNATREQSLLISVRSAEKFAK